MNKRSNYLNILGLAQRAGKCVSGTEQIIQEIRKQKVYLILIANDCAQTTKKKLIDKSESYQIPYIETANRVELGNAIGKEERVAIALSDKGFARKIQALLL